MWKLKLCSGCGRDGRKCAVEKMKLEGEGPVYYTLLGYNLGCYMYYLNLMFDQFQPITQLNFNH